MIRTLYYAADGIVHDDLRMDQLSGSLGDAKGLLWIDFQGEPNETAEPILRNIFGFHPLAIDDALQESHIPRVDDWEQYLYVVLHTVVFAQEDGPQVDTLELDVFLGPNYVVTHHDTPIPAIDHVWQRCHLDDRLMRSGADRLFYELSDQLVVRYLPAIEALDDAIDQMETDIFAGATAGTLETLFMLKRAVVHLRRIIAPQREVFNRLARDSFRTIDAKTRVYFRDIYDHLVRLHETSDSMRDLVSGAVDMHLSATNNRLSDAMKALTMITTLFMPISFLAGFFGMNFFAPVETIPLWTSKSALLCTLALMALSPVAMYWLLRRRGWL
jgi:magnesium transporter